MGIAIEHALKKEIETSIKFVFAALPIVGVLFGIGVGQIIAQSGHQPGTELYLLLASLVIPPLAVYIFACRYYFRKIARLAS